jgi:endo-1,4-beta-D-glucanase Y
VKQGCGGYYVRSGGGTGSDVGDEVSEGHGYGMVITALMAGQDPDAKKIFDGMYAFFRKFPSSNQADLMGWTVDVAGGCKFPTGTSDSATDGDLDIAFSLLLADKQWGSAGAINYLAEAKKVIAAIKRGDINPTTHLTNLGDWASTTDFSTRPSDFMQDHFRAFGRATGDTAWTSTVDAVYSLETKIQTGFSPSTALMPDFVVNTNTSPRPDRRRQQAHRLGLWQWPQLRLRGAPGRRRHGRLVEPGVAGRPVESPGGRCEPGLLRGFHQDAVPAGHVWQLVGPVS